MKLCGTNNWNIDEETNASLLDRRSVRRFWQEDSRFYRGWSGWELPLHIRAYLCPRLPDISGHYLRSDQQTTKWRIRDRNNKYCFNVATETTGSVFCYERWAGGGGKRLQL